MKWPIKPPELDLHQLEERLIALRIPFMQIRKLPRGGQYSLEGNVINVPVDIQPTVNSLPRAMDKKFTVAIQLKKMLLHPLDEDIEKYKTKHSELQKSMNEYKEVTDIAFDEFLKQVAKMDLENYVKRIRSSLSAPNIYLKRNPNEMRITLFNKTILLG